MPSSTWRSGGTEGSTAQVNATCHGPTDVPEVSGILALDERGLDAFHLSEERIEVRKAAGIAAVRNIVHRHHDTVRCCPAGSVV